MFCTTCGGSLAENHGKFCRNCGTGFTRAALDTQTQYSVTSQELLQNKYRTKDIMALIFAIIAIVLPVPWFDLAFGITAFVIARKLKKEGYKTVAYWWAHGGLIASALFTFLMAFDIISI